MTDNSPSLGAPQDRPERTSQESPEWTELRRLAKEMREAACARIRADAWRWSHVPPDTLESVIGAIGEISVIEARIALDRLNAELQGDVAVPARAHHEEKEKDVLSRVVGERLSEGTRSTAEISTGDK